MEEHRRVFGIKSMCRVLKVSRSGYYAWRERKPGKRKEANKRLFEHIKAVYRESRSLYGSPRITAELNERGMACGKNRVARIMKDNGIRAQVKRRFKRTTDSRHGYPVAANLVLGSDERQLKRLWVADITYIPTREGWLYLSAVMNVRSRKIIGLSMNNELTQELTMTAMREAVTRERLPEGLIHHSDRGRQYATYAYQELLKRHGIISSMSRKGNCYDNAFMESFFGTLKRELVHGERYQTRQEARLSIFEYVEVFYNRIRRHSALGHRSPEQYERLLIET
jgi:putative transposase